MAHKALLVGINQYRNVTALRGCHNDVRNMQALLSELFGFEPDRINRLMEQDVTRSELRSRMDWLLAGAAPGDRIVFHFSGHGSYVEDRETDEPDRRDELVCLWRYPDEYLTDDELRSWTLGCPGGVNLTVVLDTCHSGTGTRWFPSEQDPDDGELVAVDTGSSDAGGFSDAEQGALRPVLSRFADPLFEAGLAAARIGLGDARAARTEEEMNHLLLAAARADQSAGDALIGGRYQGVFTYYLCAVARHYRGELSCDQLIAVVNENLRRKRYGQVPQLEGPAALRARRVFA